MTDIPLVTLWEFVPPKGNTVRLTSSPPVRVEQNPFPNRGIWVGGTPYYCCGINVSGVERTTGRVPTITVTVKLNEYVRARKDVIFVAGTRATRFQCDALCADGLNWASGVNPFGTPKRTNHRVDRWVVTRVLGESNETISLNAQNEQAFWEDVIRPDVPGRCYHTYRGTACGYTGTQYWDFNGNTVSTAAEDVCGLTIRDCELRFSSGNLPYGGLPDLGGAR